MGRFEGWLCLLESGNGLVIACGGGGRNVGLVQQLELESCGLARLGMLISSRGAIRSASDCKGLGADGEHGTAVDVVAICLSAMFFDSLCACVAF